MIVTKPPSFNRWPKNCCYNEYTSEKLLSNNRKEEFASLQKSIDDITNEDYSGFPVLNNIEKRMKKTKRQLDEVGTGGEDAEVVNPLLYYDFKEADINTIIDHQNELKTNIRHHTQNISSMNAKLESLQKQCYQHEQEYFGKYSELSTTADLELKIQTLIFL